MGDHHVIEIAADELSDEALRDAVAEATTNGLDNLIVLHTTADENTIMLNLILSKAAKASVKTKKQPK